MATKGRGPLSETRIAVATSEERDIELALNLAETHVARMTPSPSTEHLRASLAKFRRAVDAWKEAPPNAADVVRLRDQVASVLQLAKTTSPTVRIRRFGSG